MNEVYSLSPSFSRQTIGDSVDDWSYMGPSKIIPFDREQCIREEQKFNFPDLIAMDYFSDGKILNNTLWFTSEIKQPVSPAITNFQILIDINSIYDTGQDYLLKIEWDNLKQNWSRTLQDISPSSGSNNIIDFGEFRVIENDESVSGMGSFFDKGKNYVELDVALDSISSPDQYNLVFMSSNSFYTPSGNFCQVVDISDRVHVPPPDVQLSLSPNSVELYPEEEETIELSLKSSSKLESHVVLYSGTISNDTEIMISPDEVNVPSTGIAISHVRVKASSEASPKISTIPIFGNMTFPTKLSNQLSGEIANNSESASIYKYSNLTINVLKPLTWSEQFNNYWEELGIPLSGLVSLITAIAAGLSSVLVYARRRKRTERRTRT
jgi:hypothetical protein